MVHNLIHCHRTRSLFTIAASCTTARALGDVYWQDECATFEVAVAGAGKTDSCMHLAVTEVPFNFQSQIRRLTQPIKPMHS